MTNPVTDNRERLRTLSLFNPFLAPNWRFERVLAILNSSRRPSRYDDQYVRKFTRFYQQWLNAADNQARQNKILLSDPELFYACMLHDKVRLGHTDMQCVLEARLLANQPIPNIAESIGTLSGAVGWYSAIFFDVVPRLKQRDWIVSQVLYPALRSHAAKLATPPSAPRPTRGSYSNQPTPLITNYYDPTLKFFAYFGGQHLLDLLLAGFQRGTIPSNPEEVVDWLRVQFEAKVSLRASQALMVAPMDNDNLQAILTAYSKTMTLRQAATPEEGKATNLEKHLLSMLAEIPWFTEGEGSRNALAGSLIKRYDNYSGELSANERLKISAGQEDPELQKLADISFDTIVQERLKQTKQNGGK